jgi:hypothetical protein
MTATVSPPLLPAQATAAHDPHRRIIGRLRPRMGQTRFEFFPVSGSDLPLTWEQMTAPLH